MPTFPFALIKHMLQRKSVQGKVVSVMRVSPNIVKATNLIVYNNDVRRAIGTYSCNPTLTMIPNNLFATSSINININNNNIFASSSSSLMKTQKLFSTNGCSDRSKTISKMEINDRNSRHHLKKLRKKLNNCLDKPNNAPDEATNILQQMLRHHPRTVNIDDCNKVLRAWHKISRQDNGPKDAPKKALKLLKQMIKIGNINKKSDVKPTVTSYNLVNEAFAYKGDINNSKLVFNLLQKDFKTNKNPNVKPNGRSYLHMIFACSRSKRDKGAPQIAKRILATMLELNKKGELKDRPNLVDYKTTMNACARNGDVAGTLSLFETIENDEKMKPDVKVYAILINALSKSRDVGSPTKAMDLLKKMNDLYLEGSIEDGPNEVTYNSVIDAYASRGDIHGASDVLVMMENDFKSGNNDAKPNRITYTSLINAWAKSRLDIAPYEAKKLLKKMVELYRQGILEEGPNAIAYTSVIDACASRGDIQGANNVSIMMENDFKSGNKDAKPNMITYTTLINAWAKSRLDIAPYEANNLLKKMVELYRQGILDDGPNAITYNSVIDTYASHGDVQGAGDVLTVMDNDFKLGNKNAKPNMRTYTVLINAWSKSGEKDAPYQAENILKKMINMFSEGLLTRGPNTISFNSVINAYAEQGDPDGANNILEMMEDYVIKSGNNDAKPDIVTYNTLIKAWYKSNDKNAPKEAEIILQDINNLYQSGDLKDGPNKFTNTLMISCLRKFKGRKKRIDQLQLMLNDVRK